MKKPPFLGGIPWYPRGVFPHRDLTLSPNMSHQRKSLGPVGVAGAVLGLTLLASRALEAANPKLLVFLHVAVKQRAFQTLLDEALPGIAVTAVGRIGDFDRALGEGPDAILTLPVVLEAKNLTPKLQGHQKSTADEKYCLVRVDDVFSFVQAKTVGVLDVLGCESTNAFVGRILDAQPKVERVTK